MKLTREKNISRYNNLFDLKLSFECLDCGAVANAYPPKEDPKDEPMSRRVNMTDTVKAVIYVDGAIDLNQDELKEKFKQAIEDNTINHFEIKTGRKDND